VGAEGVSGKRWGDMKGEWLVCECVRGWGEDVVVGGKFE